jgi:hypothetical protein
MRSTLLSSLCFGVLVISAPAGAATFTFSTAAQQAFVDARVTGVLNGYVCGNQHDDVPAVIVAPYDDTVQAGSGPCTGTYTSHAWVRYATITPAGMGGEGSSDAAYLGGGTGFVPEGNSTLGIGLTLDDAATVRFHVVWHKEATGTGQAHFNVVLRPGTVGNILSGVNTDPADGDVTVDVPLAAATEYHFQAILTSGAGTNPFDGNQPPVSSAGTYSVTIGFAPVAGVNPPSIAATTLGSPVPNPSRSGVELALALDADADVRFDVVDLAGRRISRATETPMTAGMRTLRWDGRDAAGRLVAPGMYFARVSVNGRPLPARSLLLVR